MCPDGIIDADLQCGPCPAGNYKTNAGVCASCSDTTPRCSECNNFTPKCTACTAPFVLGPQRECICPVGKFDTGTTCLSPNTSCKSNEYTDNNNTCQPCGDNCDACEDSTGICKTCAATFHVDFGNKKNCITCTVPIGLIEDLPSKPAACLSKKFSATRTIPPFPAGLRELDWRDWGVIRPIDDQGECGSCYAFSISHSIESVNAIRTGEVY